MHTEPVTILRGAPTTSRYGDAALDWASATRTTVGGIVWPASTVESVEPGRDRTVTRWMAAVPYGTDVTVADRVEVRGKAWAVDGDPAPWKSPFSGREYGLVVTLRRWTADGTQGAPHPQPRPGDPQL